MVFNHHYFDDRPNHDPEAQQALSIIYRDALAFLDALGWRPTPKPPPSTSPHCRPHRPNSAPAALTSA
jgi:hypothetical protein